MTYSRRQSLLYRIERQGLDFSNRLWQQAICQCPANLHKFSIPSGMG
nr:hypothetical protein [Aulosira sp. DedVER01a]